MRMLSILIALPLACADADVASAQTVPRYVPSRDVTVQYDVTADQTDVAPNVLVRISAAGRVRIETPDRGTVLYDVAGGAAHWLLPGSNVYVDLPVRGTLAGAFVPDTATHFTRGGMATVAGLRCTNWDVTTPRGSGTACITADGVILRGQGHDAHGHAGSLTARYVEYGTLPPDLFEPPHGATHLQLPRGLSLPKTAAP